MPPWNKPRLVAVSESGRRIGEHHPNAVLTDHEVSLLLALREEGLSLGEIARKMEVTKGCVWKIVHGHRRASLAASWVRVRKG